MAIEYNNQKIVTDGIVFYLDAANRKSYPGTGTTWYDLSGNNNNATLVGNNSTVSHSTGGYFTSSPSNPNDSASADDGAYWSVNYDSSLSHATNKAWTVMGFLNLHGYQSTNGTGWFHMGADSDLHIEPLGNNIRVNGTSGWSSPSVNVSAYHNSFAMYTFTYSTTGTYGTDYGTLKMYINDTLTHTKTDFIPGEDNGGGISLGRRNGHLRHYLDGDTVGYLYYTRELSETEIKQNFNALRGRYGI